VKRQEGTFIVIKVSNFLEQSAVIDELKNCFQDKVNKMGFEISELTGPDLSEWMAKELQPIESNVFTSLEGDNETNGIFTPFCDEIRKKQTENKSMGDAVVSMCELDTSPNDDKKCKFSLSFSFPLRFPD
jgi:hypothetical protein